MDDDDARLVGLYVDGDAELEIRTAQCWLPLPCGESARANCITSAEPGFLRRLRKLLPVDSILYLGDEAVKESSTLFVFSWPKCLATAMRGEK